MTYRIEDPPHPLAWRAEANILMDYFCDRKITRKQCIRRLTRTGLDARDAIQTLRDIEKRDEWI